MRGGGLALLDHRVAGERDGGPGHGHGPRRNCCDSQRGDIAVALAVVHLVGGNTEALRDHLHKAGFVALPLALTGHDQINAAFFGEFDLGALMGKPADAFQIGRDATPPDLAGRFARSTARLIAVPVRQRNGLVEDRLEFPGIIGSSDRCLVRHPVRRDHVAPTQRNRVVSGLARSLVDQPLDDVGRLLAARAPVGADRIGMGQNETHVDIDLGRAVHERQAVGHVAQWHAGAVAGVVSAHGVIDGHTERQEVPVGVQRQ